MDARGSTHCKVDPRLHEELWRHRDRKGAYTWLFGPAAESLAATGDDDFIEDLMDEVGRDPPSIQRVLVETFDCINVFCGPQHWLSDEMAREGMRVGPHLDNPCFKAYLRQGRWLE